jgi:spermidine synthase
MYGGHLIFETYDSYGEIRVIEQGAKRLLAFGPGDEQSACLKANPAALIFDYTQAMLLSLLYTEPRKILLIGLGAGSLATCLHTHYTACQLTAIELRQSVIDVAYRYFGLPRSKRLKIQCQEGLPGINSMTQQQDIIFSDIYLHEGMHGNQRNQDYIRRCRELLKPTGVLVTNCWREHKEDNEVLDLLKSNFNHVSACNTHDHNWLLFASAQPFTKDALRQQNAKALSKTLGFSLLKHLKRLQVV